MARCWDTPTRRLTSSCVSGGQRLLAVLYISLGAAIGANLRYFVGIWAAQQFGAVFPYGTLIINVTGSFVLGLFLTLLSDRFEVDPAWRLFIAVGLCGGYTTFSTFSVEIVSLMRQGMLLPAGLYAFSSMFLGVLAVFVGGTVARFALGE